MHRRFLSFLIFLLMQIIATPQGVAVGDWRDHLPYSTVHDVAAAEDLMYAATPYSLFVYDDYNGTVSRMSKVEGLSDIGIAAIEYSEAYKILVIGYTNTNIDLILPDSSVYNMPDIVRKSIPGNKSINDIRIYGRYAYLSCGFGIVVVDIERREIHDTYYIGDLGAQVNVQSIAINDTAIFAASDQGIYEALLSSSNLAYFGNWHVMNSPVDNGQYEKIDFFQNKLIVWFEGPVFGDDTLFTFDGNVWDTIPYFANEEINGFNVTGNQLIISAYSYLQLYDLNLQNDGIIFTYNGQVPFPLCASYSNDGFLYIGDNNYGLIKNWAIWNNVFIRPQGPYSTNCFSIAINGDYISKTAGGFNETWLNLYRAADLSVFSNESWESFYGFITPGLDTINDLVCSQTDPLDPTHIFAGSYGSGLLEFRNGVLEKVYDDSNSSLLPVYGQEAVKVTGLKYDSDGNLWINTIGNNSFLSVLKGDGTMKTFSFSSSYQFGSGSSPVIDQNNDVWIALPRGEGVFVFRHNGTIDLTSDDQSRKLTTAEGSGALPSLYINALAVDRENEIWIGSDMGIAVIYNPSNVFDGGSYDAEQILVDVGGYVQPLLESERIKCIAVDGANRKWIGTEKAGAFLVSEDGIDEIYHFTTENSPLLSNDINGIAIHPSSGEVFFATSEGIVSFRGTATEPVETLDSVLIFPNPVPSGFTGYVSVTGLTAGAWVSITDMYGTLVYRTRALGGQAVWNGLDMSGDRPATGVYIVHITNDDGSLTRSSRFMFYH